PLDPAAPDAAVIPDAREAEERAVGLNQRALGAVAGQPVVGVDGEDAGSVDEAERGVEVRGHAFDGVVKAPVAAGAVPGGLEQRASPVDSCNASVIRVDAVRASP